MITQLVQYHLLNRLSFPDQCEMLHLSHLKPHVDLALYLGSFYFTGLFTDAPVAHCFHYSRSVFQCLVHWSQLIPPPFFFFLQFSLVVLVYSIQALKTHLTLWVMLKLHPTQCFLTRVAFLTT